MMMEEPAPLINPAPVVHRKRTSARSAAFQKSRAHAEEDEGTRDPFDAEEVFEHIKDINDPEHPYSLEQVSGGGNTLVGDGQHVRCCVTHVLCVCLCVCLCEGSSFVLLQLHPNHFPSLSKRKKIPRQTFPPCCLLLLLLLQLSLSRPHTHTHHA